VVFTVHNARLGLRPDQVPNHRLLLAPKRFGYRWAYRLAGRAGGSFVAVSADVGAAVRQEVHPPAGRLHVIPNGVDVARYGRPDARASARTALNIAPTAPVLVSVAKLHEQKGHADLIESLPSVVAAHSNLLVLIVGDGPLRERLVAQVDAAGLAKHVRFLGVRADVPDLLSAADLFVLPSHWEGLPMALLEAMASSLPSVVTDVSGAREVTRPGATGIVVPPGQPKKFGAAIVELLGDRVRAVQMGRAAQEQVVRSHSVGLQAQRHADLYSSLLRGGAPVRTRHELRGLPQ
jgi:glycosyltransferase involved in cell wall biosynthesis